jgi:hypothetical protein
VDGEPAVKRRHRSFSYQPGHLPPTWSPEWENTPEQYAQQVQLRRELIAAGNPGMSGRDVKIAEVVSRLAGDAGLTDSSVMFVVRQLAAALDEVEDST